VQSSSQIISINKPTSSYLQSGCPSCHPTNSVRHSTEGKNEITVECSWKITSWSCQGSAATVCRWGGHVYVSRVSSCITTVGLLQRSPCWAACYPAQPITVHPPWRCSVDLQRSSMWSRDITLSSSTGSLFLFQNACSSIYHCQ